VNGFAHSRGRGDSGGNWVPAFGGDERRVIVDGGRESQPP